MDCPACEVEMLADPKDGRLICPKCGYNEPPRMFEQRLHQEKEEAAHDETCCFWNIEQVPPGGKEK